MKPKIKFKRKKYLFFTIPLAVLVLAAAFYFVNFTASNREKLSVLEVLSMDLGKENEELKRQLSENLMKLGELESQDQFKINSELKQKIASIESTYKKAVSTYEELVKLKENSSHRNSQ